MTAGTLTSALVLAAAMFPLAAPASGAECTTAKVLFPKSWCAYR